MWLFAFLVGSVAGNYPVFDATTQMKNLLVPADLPAGSIIYRLRATDADRDYPLIFDATDYGSYVIRIENLPCLRNTTYCEANVYLERVLVPGQVFKFRLTVKDAKGLTTTLPVSIQVTNARTEANTIFPHIPGLIVVPEDTKVGTELEYVIVRKNLESKKPAMLELWGTTEFSFRQSQNSKDTTTGVILLSQPLDFERRTMYKLWVFATDMAVETGRDSRNIAGFELVIVVQDVQDTPPIFQQHQNPVTKLRSTLKEGDLVTRVMAVDGDRGSPRTIKYGLVSEGNPFTIFFNIDRNTGDIFLARSMKELSVIARSHQPILLNIIAEEEITKPKDSPALSSIMTLALLLGEAGNSPPYFDNPSYVCRLDENSLQGTALVFGDAYSMHVHDDDMGKQGVFSLNLEGQNGTFEITPSVAERNANFMIRVRNSALLDYEQRHSLQFMIVAKELGTESKPSFSSNSSVLVYLNDVNDNPPQFLNSKYMVQIPENITANTKILQVNATDRDEGPYASIRYTGILGYKNTSLTLDPITGEIKVAMDNHGFDREEAAEYRFLIEARDMEGVGLRTTVPFILQMLDINDETPIFERSPTQFILTSDWQNFSERAFVKAIDRDAEPPNNIVKYEIISGNYDNKFILNPDTGELTVRDSTSDILRSKRRPKRQTSNSKPNVQVLTVRAYDLGVPHRSTTSQIRVYPADSKARTMTFILPGISLDWRTTEEFLAELTGARISIRSMQPYQNNPSTRLPSNLPPQNLPPSNTDKSVVTATVSYYPNAVVDVSHLQDRFAVNKTAVVVNQTVQEYRAENQVLFWLLILLAFLILLALISFLLCGICPCCPLYTFFTRQRKVQSVDSVSRRRYLRESKSTQVAESENSKEPQYWYYNRPQAKDPDPAYIVLTTQQPSDRPSSAGPRRIMVTDRERPVKNHASQLLNDTTNIDAIYTTRANNNPNQHPDRIYLEDIGDEQDFHVLDPSRLSMPLATTHGRNELEQNSFRRHEVERGSELDKDSLEIDRHPSNDPRVYHSQYVEHGEPSRYHESMSEQFSRPDKDVQSHEEMFIKEGNAEILRLRTRDNQQHHETNIDDQDELPAEEVGKNILMRRFIDDQNGDGHMSIINENLLSNNLLLTRYFIEEQQRGNQNRGAIDTQSLPGNTMLSMATQTDCNQSTQTETLYLMRPPKRKAKSDCGDSSDSNDEGDRIKRRERLISIQINSGAGKNQQQSHPIKSPILEESESSPESHASKYGKGKQRQRGYGSSVSLTDIQNDAKFLGSRHDFFGSDHDFRTRKNLSKRKGVKDDNSGEHSDDRPLTKSQSCAAIHPEVLEKQLRTQDYIPKSLKARFLSRNRNCIEIKSSGVITARAKTKNTQPESCRSAEWNATRGNVKRKAQEESKTKASAFNSLHNNYSSTNGLKNVLKSNSEKILNGGERVPRNASTDPKAIAMGQEDEADSGIVMATHLKGSQNIVHKHQDLLEKKSVFTIAYGDVETKQIQPESSSSPP